MTAGRMGPLALAGVCALAQQPLDRSIHSSWHWRMAYFHDEDQTTLVLRGIEAGGGGCAVAFGRLHGGPAPRDVALRTENGGIDWELVRLEDTPVSGHLLSKRLGWMVGSRGLWRTGDCGKTWKEVAAVKDLLRVYFLDEDLGFAAGHRRQLLKTTDGGHHWSGVAIADEPQTTPERSYYSWIDFAQGRFGIAVGASEPRPVAPAQRAPRPWLDPETVARRRQLPSLALTAQTVDGGATWRGSSMSILGNITRVRLGPDGRALSLVEFPLSFDWPSEVYLLTPATGDTIRVFREKDRAVTDIALLPGGAAHLAAVEPQGSVRQLPIPGTVRMSMSLDLSTWRDVEVDYRAVAGRVWLAASPGNPILAATDTGMVLSLGRR